MLTWGDALASCQGGPQARALFKPVAAILRAASAAFLGSTAGCTAAALAGVRATARSCVTTACGALFVGADIAAVLLNLALLAQLGIAPALRVSHNQVYALYAGSRHLLLGVLRLGAHTDGEQSEVRETHALAVENQLLQMVECIHQHTVDSTTRVWRAVVGDVRYESLEVHFAVSYRSSIPLLLTCVFICVNL